MTRLRTSGAADFESLAVILTRLQRVTFLTAHKYLGLTREVIRTEKAINELACYPLPEAFAETGGIHRLRQRFQPETAVPRAEAEPHIDYFALDTPFNGPAMGESFWGREDERDSEGVRLRYRPTLRKASSSSNKATDRLSMSSLSDEDGRFPSPPKMERTNTFRPGEEFDLRDAVMECISKAIGLVQPSVTPAASNEASPSFRAHDQNLQKAVFNNSSFGSLSLLGLSGLDDESSMTGSSVASFSSTELENEVEILYFPKGSMLVKEGEKNAGLYFVIEGFLDVSMPENSATSLNQKPTTMPTTNIPHSAAPPASARTTPRRPGLPTEGRTPVPNRIPPLRPRFDQLPPLSTELPSGPPPPPTSTPLFTVKPGGIAGYLSSLSGFPSYVDITAKTECYVGFLPAKALERIMDRKPIVLLTLAKRLISLLSPLGDFYRLDVCAGLTNSLS